MQLNHTERNYHLRMKDIEIEDYDSLDELSKLFTSMFIQDLKRIIKKDSLHLILLGYKRTPDVKNTRTKIT